MYAIHKREQDDSSQTYSSLEFCTIILQLGFWVGVFGFWAWDEFWERIVTDSTWIEQSLVLNITKALIIAFYVRKPVCEAKKLRLWLFYVPVYVHLYMGCVAVCGWLYHMCVAICWVYGYVVMCRGLWDMLWFVLYYMYTVDYVFVVCWGLWADEGRFIQEEGCIRRCWRTDRYTWYSRSGGLCGYQG